MEHPQSYPHWALVITPQYCGLQQNSLTSRIDLLYGQLDPCLIVHCVNSARSLPTVIGQVCMMPMILTKSAKHFIQHFYH